MDPFRTFTDKIFDLLDGIPSKRFSYSQKNAAAFCKSELILLKDSAFELGGGNLPCVGLSVIANGRDLNNETVVIGKDLNKLSCDTPFAKIVLVDAEVPQDDEQELYKAVKEIEYVKYRTGVSGFMSRASAIDHREQVRVGRSALKQGLSFEKVGNALIGAYLDIPFVKAATVVFITSDSFDYASLYTCADKISEVTKALNHIFDNVLVDCKNCNLKQICDEVEGMRELHINMAKK